MTANDLYEIVRDVPREAWPAGYVYDWNYHGPKRAKYWHKIDSRRDDDETESAFVGSMTAWLLRQEWRGLGRGHLLIDELDDGDVAIDMQYVELDGTTETYRICDMHASSLVAALAAACKEVGNA